MARREVNRKRTRVFWGSGSTDLFLHTDKSGNVSLIDYEYDTYYVHTMCGGNCYYTSRSQWSGVGYIDHPGELTPVGYYRIDTTHNDSQNCVEAMPGIVVLVPYATHTANKSSILEEYPVVIKQGIKVIFCDFNDLGRLLERLGTGQEPNDYSKAIKKKRVFENEDSFEVVCFEFWDLFNGGTQYYSKKNLDPWEFVKVPKEYNVSYPDQKLYRIFHVTGGTTGENLLRTVRIDNELYSTGMLSSKVFESGVSVASQFKGWEAASEVTEANIVFRYKQNEVFIVGWLEEKKACEREFARISSRYNVEEITMQEASSRYIEYTLDVPKILFLMKKERYLKEVCAGLKRKARKQVLSVIREKKKA